jgi:hypothetical protein
MTPLRALLFVDSSKKLAHGQSEGCGESCQMAKSDLPHAALKIGYMHLMDSGLFRQIDLSPPSLLTEISDSPAELDTDIRGHSSSIDLVEALYLVDALFCPEQLSGRVFLFCGAPPRHAT